MTFCRSQPAQPAQPCSRVHLQHRVSPPPVFSFISSTVFDHYLFARSPPTSCSATTCHFVSPSASCRAPKAGEFLSFGDILHSHYKCKKTRNNKITLVFWVQHDVRGETREEVAATLDVGGERKNTYWRRMMLEMNEKTGGGETRCWR